MSRYSIKKIVPALSLAALMVFGSGSKVLASGSASDSAPSASNAVVLTPAQERQIMNIQLYFISANAALTSLEVKDDCARAMNVAKDASRLEITGTLPEQINGKALEAVMAAIEVFNFVERSCADYSALGLAPSP